MAGNFEGIKTRNFGIEIEMTGLTRCQAARAIAKVLGGTAFHEGGNYDKYTVDDEQGRTWSIVYDGSVKCVDANGNHASKSYSVELNSPVLGYEDIPLLQEVIRALRHAKGRCGPEYCCGTHIHISADDYTPQQIRNLVNIFASKEDFLWDGSNINLEQMAFRCPNSKVVGTRMIPDYELEFRGVATIVPKEGAEVPVLLWEIDQRDELSLDRYEGFPRMYRKELFEVEVDGKIREGMAYLMNCGEIAPPSPTYYNGIKKGYEANGMDTSYLRAALERAVYHAQHQEQEEDEDLDEDFEETDDFQMTFE